MVKWGYIAHLTLIPTSLGYCHQGDARNMADVKPLHKAIYRPYEEYLLGLFDNLYGSCGSRNYRRIGRRATDLKNGNAGPKLHWLVWEESGFSALPSDRGISAINVNPF